MTDLRYVYGLNPTVMTVGDEFQIPDGAPKYWGSLIFHAGDGAGQFISRDVSIIFMGEPDITHHTYFQAVQPGYQVFSYTWGGLTSLAIKVIGEDGVEPVGGTPTAHDDHIVYSRVQNQAPLIGSLLDNDVVPVLDTAFNIETRSVSGNVDIFVDAWPDHADVLFYSPNDPYFIGSGTAEYRIADAMGNWSNWAKVTIELLGDNASKNDLEGTEWEDTVDFSTTSDAINVHGLGGDDTIRGSQAGDNLNGDDGADRIGGKGGNDIINGGNGNDTIFGDAGNDTIDGGADNDTLWGGDGNDIIRGGLGNDQVYGEAGDDQVGGKAGNDAVHGGAGNDTIWGDEGNDALYGDAGNDNLNGGAGNDFLTGGLGIDRMRGEAGVDTFVFMRGQAQGDTILDFEGAGVVGGDKIEFRGYGAGATVHQVSGDTWQIDAAGISETFKIAGVSNLSKVDFYFN